MFLRLIIDGPYPDERVALGALDAVRIICALGGVEPLMAWRDHVALEAWQSGWNADDMVSPAERAGAAVWGSALLATRRALDLPSDARLAIEFVFTQPSPLSDQHGPERYVWRRNWAWGLEERARMALTKVRQI